MIYVYVQNHYCKSYYTKMHTRCKIACVHTSGLPVESTEFILSGVAELEVF